MSDTFCSYAEILRQIFSEDVKFSIAEIHRRINQTSKDSLMKKTFRLRKPKASHLVRQEDKTAPQFSQILRYIVLQANRPSVSAEIVRRNIWCIIVTSQLFPNTLSTHSTGSCNIKENVILCKLSYLLKYIIVVFLFLNYCVPVYK